MDGLVTITGQAVVTILCQSAIETWKINDRDDKDLFIAHYSS